MSLLFPSPYEKKLVSWASFGLLVFVSSFSWAPSRDGLQIVFLFSLLIPILLFFFKYPKEALPKGRINLAAFTYAAYAAVSSLWGSGSDFGYFIFILFTLIIWLSGSHFVFTCRPSLYFNIRHLIYFCIVGAIFCIGSVAYHYLYGKPTIFFSHRVTGWNVFRNPNEFGAACGVFSVIALSLGLQTNKIKHSYALFLLSALCLIGVITSFSRGPLIAYCTTAVLAVFIIRPKLIVWGPPIFAVILFILAFLLFSGIHTFYNLGRDSFSGGRIEMWSYLFDNVTDHFWFGLGMSKETTVFIPALNTTFNHLHNAFLDSFYRTGFIGMIFLSWHIFEILRRFSKSPVLFPFYLWFIYGIATMLFDGRCIFWEMGAKWFLYWIPAAFIAAATTLSLRIDNIERKVSN